MSPLQFGVATALAGVGGLLGAGISSAGGRRLGTGGAVIAAHVVTTVGVCAMVLGTAGPRGWPATVVLGAGQACHGFGIGFSNSHEMSYRQTMTPDALQARTNTTMRSINRAVIVVVAPLGGLLADQAGTRAALLVAAAIFATSAFALAASSVRHAPYPSVAHRDH